MSEEIKSLVIEKYEDSYNVIAMKNTEDCCGLQSIEEVLKEIKRQLK